MPLRVLCHPLTVLLAAFAALRLWAYGAGLSFDDETFLRFWHAIDPPLLRSRLWESLLYLHTQPPLFNGFVGVVHQLVPHHSGVVFHAIFVFLGVVQLLSVYGLGRALGWGTWLSALASGLVVLSPSALLYEHFLFYTYPTAVLLSLSGLSLVHALRRGSGPSWLLFFTTVALLVGLRSLFHGAWALAALLLALWASPRRRVVLTGALFPLLFIGLIYAKNVVLFGECSTSSWLGMSLARMSTDRLAEEPLESLIVEANLHPIARVRPFEHLSVYASFVDTTSQTGVPLLDASDKQNGAINLHHHAYLEISSLYAANFVSVIRSRPALYWRRVRRARDRFWSPSWRYPPLDENRAAVSALVGPVRSDLRAGILRVTALAGLLGGAASMRRSVRDSSSWLRLWLCGLLVYVWLIGTLLEVGENYRFRFLVMAPLVLLFVDLLHRLWRWLRSSDRRRRRVL